jgi:exopolysaccharide biosynthesis polyprenyl glycosylphosphotransferase
MPGVAGRTSTSGAKDNTAAGLSTPGTSVDEVAGTVDVRLSAQSSHRAWLVLKGIIALADLTTVATSMVIAISLCRLLPVAQNHGWLLVAILSLPLWCLALLRFGLYRTYVIASRIEEFNAVVRAVAATAATMAIVAFAFRLDISRSWLLMTVVVAVVLLTLERKLARELLLGQRRRGRFLHRAIIVGDNLEALGLCEVLSSDPYLAYEVAGFLTNNVERGTRLWSDRPVLGRTEQALEVVARYGLSNAVIATTSVDQATTNRLVRDFTAAGLHVDLSSALSDIAAGRLRIRPFVRYPVLHVDAVGRHGWRLWAKRTLDVVGSVVLLVVTAPLVAISAVAIKLDSSGPCLFRQERLGQDGRRFMVFKLRTMEVEAEANLESLRHRNESSGPLFKIRDDPRVTPIGRVLRRYSIDELPQLWNVLRGEMSLVGPRPALPSEAEHWSPEVYARIKVKPGITGMWQVRGRSSASFEEYLRLDMYYVDNWSLWSDLAILLKTVPAVVLKRGAY